MSKYRHTEHLTRQRRVTRRPEPDTDWGWAVEDRLARVEDSQKWILRLIIAGMVAGMIEALLRGLH